MAALGQQIESLQTANRCLQQKIQHATSKANDCMEADGAGHEQAEQRARLRISELLLSDNLIHEENAKVVAELKAKNEKGDAENRKLMKKLEE